MVTSPRSALRSTARFIGMLRADGARCVPEWVSPHGLKPCFACQSLRGLPADACFPMRGLPPSARVRARPAALRQRNQDDVCLFGVERRASVTSGSRPRRSRSRRSAFGRFRSPDVRSTAEHRISTWGDLNDADMPALEAVPSLRGARILIVWLRLDFAPTQRFAHKQLKQRRRRLETGEFHGLRSRRGPKRQPN